MRGVLPCKLSLYCVLALAVATLAGCAGKGLRVKDKGPNGEPGPRPEKSITLEKPEEEVFADEKGRFKVVSTPSGYVKQRIERPEKDAERRLPPKVGSAPPSREGKAEKAPLESRSQPSRPAPKPPEKPKRKEVPEDSGQKIVLNFDNADLYEVINTIADLLDINYIVDPKVRGTVTIYTARGLHKKDLLTVFFQILEVNGLTAIKEGSLYKIVQLKDAPRKGVSVLEEEEVAPGERIIIQIIPLKFMSVQEMTKLLTPFVSAGGTIVSDASSNTLLVVDKGVNILKILRLVEAFDVNMFEKVYYRFYALRYQDAEEVAKILKDFSSSYGDVSNVVVKFIAIDRLNTLLTVSTSPLVFEKIEEILRQIDVVVEEAEPRIYVYFVKNGEAEDLAGLLNEVFSGGGLAGEKRPEIKRKAGGAARISGNPFSQSRMREKEREKAVEKTKKPEVSKKAEPAVEDKGKGSGSLRDEVRITPDKMRNALIIEATPQDYRIVEGILGRLDVLPRQVLIEATIAEVTRDDETDIGINWALGKGAVSGDAAFKASVDKTGLKYSIGVTDKWYAALSAYAKKGKVNVLSSPHILASDNKEAKIDVSREIPVASSEWTYATGIEPVTQTNIQYRDTGVILSVTPHINERGLVTMDITEEVSDLEKDSVKVAGVDYPSFFKRTVSTTLTVKHGQTIAIGGLIKDKEDSGISGVPCLISIPVVRYLAGKWGKTVTKVELIILITPKVIVGLDDVDAVTEEFKQKVKNVMKRFGQ